MADLAACLYCDQPTGSLEHVLASGIGGRLATTTLLCCDHNNLCGRWADDPLSKQFEYAIHCLEARKGDGTRGTTWHGLVAQDGQRFDILADFTARMKQHVETTETGGKRITTTHPEGLKKIETDLEKAYDFAESFTMIRSDNFRPICKATDDGMRGILKAALHFVAMQTTNEAEARSAATSVAAAIFCDAIPTEHVHLQPYDPTRARGTPHRHTIVAWNEDDVTKALVTIFNIVTYIVILPHVTISPCRYVQDTRSGQWTVAACDVPQGSWYGPERAKEDWQEEYGLRVDLIVALGQSKSHIADIIRDALEEPQFNSFSREQKIEFLTTQVDERFRYPLERIPIWFLRDVNDFVERRVLATV
ncbi:MAG TPA: hypothetical protein VHS78_16705 [Candidatus Elarobacter sp.]|nr:hypothetical protein [Candidatus Elarobacter sp.]